MNNIFPIIWCSASHYNLLYLANYIQWTASTSQNPFLKATQTNSNT